MYVRRCSSACRNYTYHKPLLYTDPSSPFPCCSAEAAKLSSPTGTLCSHKTGQGPVLSTGSVSCCARDAKAFPLLFRLCLNSSLRTPGVTNRTQCHSGSYAGVALPSISPTHDRPGLCLVRSHLDANALPRVGGCSVAATSFAKYAAVRTKCGICLGIIGPAVRVLLSLGWVRRTRSFSDVGRVVPFRLLPRPCDSSSRRQQSRVSWICCHEWCENNVARFACLGLHVGFASAKCVCTLAQGLTGGQSQNERAQSLL